MHRLAEFTQDTVYLSERSGLEAVCANRALGDYRQVALARYRHPQAARCRRRRAAILCSLPPAEARAIVEANAHRYEKFASFTADFLYGAEGRARGYCFLDGAVTPGTASMGVAFPPHNPVAAISVAAISSRLQPERRAIIAQQMHREVRKIVAAMEAATVSNGSSVAGA